MDYDFKYDFIDDSPKDDTSGETPEQKLLKNIREVCRMIDNAYMRFEYEADSDLVEASIYELEALKARYRYLLRLAKAQNISSIEIQPTRKKDRRFSRMG